MGPFGGDPCVLYTVVGGPAAPKELADPYLTAEERPAAEAFWREHALADGTSGGSL